jgi:hypothetical protein
LEAAKTEADPGLPGLGPGSPALSEALAAALLAKGPNYAPRTHHLHPDGRPKFTNRLIRENSPYLLQHAHNPVNWYPWGDEAFERAGREGKPVLLSIGYSTCHWCHVMERESFEDEEVAAFINQNYVAIKVDREERPDVDDVYMSAVQMLAGRGGWPMTLLLTPERQPFFAGTYFPARTGDRGSRKGFLTILKEMRDQYEEDPQELVDKAADTSQKLARASTPRPGGSVPGPEVIARGVEWLKRNHDPQWGGFGRAPKFPRPVNLEILLRYFRRTQDAEALAAAETTLQKMIEGGMHDHVGGGFHRYSTDTRWLVPHFEKMLYDNAQLTNVLLEAYQVTGNELYAQVARKTLDYLDREMSHPGGGFYSATDADSPNPEKGHDDEGWFFTWTPDEVTELVGEQRGKMVVAYYGMTGRGNFEGRNILRTWKPLDEVASELSVDAGHLASELEASRQLMYDARLKRPPPLRDDKILTSWNGLTISAFARAGFVLNEPRYVERAEKGASFVLDHLRDDEGRLLRSFLDQPAKQRGFLDDYAFFIQGLLDLYEVSSDLQWLERAVTLQGLLDAFHADQKGGGYFTTASDGEALLARQKPDYDGAEPSGNSVAALNLVRLAELTGKSEYAQTAEGVFGATSQRMRRSPNAVPKLLTALDYALDRPLQIFVVSPEGEVAPEALLEIVRRAYVPNRIVSVCSESDLQNYVSRIPAIEGKRALKGQTTAYVCERGVCQLPTSDPTTLARQLERVTPYETVGG